MSPDRLSPLDASFLHIEDHVSHMHIASVAIFEGPPPPFGDIVAMVDAKLDLVPRYRQKVRFVPFELGRPVWVDDPHFNIEYHLRHTALPSPGGESELRKLVGRVMAQQLDRSKPLWEIWVVEGLEDGRWAMLAKTHHALVDGISGTDLLAVIMDLSRGRRAPGAVARGRRSPNRPGSSSCSRRWRTSCSPPMSRSGRRGRRRGPLRRMAGYALEVAGGLFSLGGLVRPTPLSSLNGPTRPPSALRLGDHVGRRHQAGAPGARRNLQRCGAGQHHQRIPRAPARARRGRGARGAHARARLGPAARRVRQGRRRRHLREQGLRHVRRASGRHRRPRAAPACDYRADEGPQGLESSRGGRGAHLHVGLRAAHAPGPRDAPRHQSGAAQREHGHHECARPAVPALRGGTPDDPGLPLRPARAARYGSASPSSPTTARSTSGSPGTTTRHRTSTSWPAASRTA